MLVKCVTVTSRERFVRKDSRPIVSPPATLVFESVLWRPGRLCASRPLLECPGRHTQKSSDSAGLSAPVSGQEDEEAGAGGLYAEPAHDSQGDLEEQNAVANGCKPANVFFKAVAPPHLHLYEGRVHQRAGQEPIVLAGCGPGWHIIEYEWLAQKGLAQPGKRSLTG